MKDTKIEWADHSWNPWRGCTKVSPGCANCYAEKLSKRNPAVLGQWGKGAPRVLAKNWGDPVRWNADFSEALLLSDRLSPNRDRATDSAYRPKVFPSLCDWLDEEVPIEWLARFMCLIHDTPNIEWLLLTKRPELFRDRMNKVACTVSMERGQSAVRWLTGNPPENVWVGASVEAQFRADERIPALLKIPARLRFLSAEPLLGEVDLRLTRRSFGFPQHITSKGHSVGMPQGIHWVIVGGESGPRSRPCNVDWIRSIVSQCATVGLPCFVKQLGADPCGYWTEGAALPFPIAGWKLRVKHPKGGDPEEWPTDLRIRQFPEVKP